MGKYKYIILFSLLLGDGIFSFFQHVNMPLDGDMSAIILPAEWYSQVLESPLGFSALIEGKTYGGSNRFFSHWSMSKYFKTIPFIIQKFTDPIDSLYIACAIFKILVQLGLITVLAFYISSTLENQFTHILLICCLLFPFFQANGFYSQIGIIDQSITYVFFYAFPILLTLIWFYPFYKNYFVYKDGNINFKNWFYLVPLAFIICFSGPLVQPVIFLVCPFSLLYLFIKNWQHTKTTGLKRIIQSTNQIPKPLLIAFSGVTLIALFSYYIGTFNVENISNNTLALSERYLKLGKGLFKYVSLKMALFILLPLIIFNIVVLIKYNLFSSRHSLFKIFIAICIFTVLYLLLLPLGGYRVYRPDIIRYDTFMPIGIAIISYAVLTSCFVSNILKQRKKAYVILLFVTLLIFQFADKIKTGSNNCEKKMLYEIAATEATEVKLTENCRVLGWFSFKKPGESRINAEMLYFWKVTDKRVLYYH